MREDTERRDHPQARRTAAQLYAGAEGGGAMLGLAAWARRTGTRVLGPVRNQRIIVDGMGWPPGPQAGGGQQHQQQQQQQQQGSGDPLLSAGSSGGHGGFQLSLEAMKALLTALPCWWEMVMNYLFFNV